MFKNMNREFGFMAKLNSVLMATNIEIDCEVQQKSGFINVNIEFGWYTLSRSCRQYVATIW